MVSLQNVFTIAIFLKFLLVSSSLAGNFTRSCEKFGGDVENGGCICNRLQNALQLDMKTTISPRFKNYVQFENIDNSYPGSECDNIKSFEVMLYCQCIYMKQISLVVAKTSKNKHSVRKYIKSANECINHNMRGKMMGVFVPMNFGAKSQCIKKCFNNYRGHHCHRFNTVSYTK